MPEEGRDIVDDVIVATSISPRDLPRQADALRTWKAAGFVLHSLNDPSEAPALAAAAAQLDIPVLSTPVAAYFGKPLPPIDAFIGHFRAQTRAYRWFGIVNSDIALVDAPRLRRALGLPAALVFGRRGEVERPGHAAGVAFDNGYDFFFLSPEAAGSLPESRFRLGAPWWDYWLPITQLLAGRRVVQVAPPVATHLRHGVAWHPLMFNDMGLHFFERLMHLRVIGRSERAMDARLYARLLENMLARVVAIEGERGATPRRRPRPLWRVVPALRAFHRVVVEGEERPDAPFATYALAELSRSVLELIDEASAVPVEMPAPTLGGGG
jgi:hypothetical protein